MVAACAQHYWDASKRVFVSGAESDRCRGHHKAWMAIAGVSSRGESADAMRKAVADPMRSGPSLLISITT
jgi:hypothetical protein